MIVSTPGQLQPMPRDEAGVDTIAPTECGPLGEREQRASAAVVGRRVCRGVITLNADREHQRPEPMTHSLAGCAQLVVTQCVEC